MVKEPKTLEQLQAGNIPHATFHEIFNVTKGEISDEQLAEMDEYLYQFAQPDETNRCIVCGEPNSGILGRFTWGVVYGEGYCAECG